MEIKNMIKIVSKQDGFWRAGVQHIGTVEYKENDFTPEQWAELKAEPKLIVIDPNEKAGVDILFKPEKQAKKEK